jgi:hypothetical protein
MASGVLFDTIALSPTISLIQASLSWSIVKNLRISLATKHDEFQSYYRGIELAVRES